VIRVLVGNESCTSNRHDGNDMRYRRGCLMTETRAATATVRLRSRSAVLIPI